MDSIEDITKRLLGGPGPDIFPNVTRRKRIKKRRKTKKRTVRKRSRKRYVVRRRTKRVVKRSSTTKVRKSRKLIKYVKKLIKHIESFPAQPVTDEMPLQDQLFNYLYTEYKPNIERACLGERKPDIIIKKKYGIEVKIGKDYNYLRGCAGQIIEYSKEYHTLLVVVLDTAKVSDPDFDKFEKLYIDTLPNTKLIRIRGEWREKKNKVPTIKIYPQQVN